LQNLKEILEDGQIMGWWFKVDLDYLIKIIYMPESPYSHSISRSSPFTLTRFHSGKLLMPAA
jgi:hypothetical protein